MQKKLNNVIGLAGVHGPGWSGGARRTTEPPPRTRMSGPYDLTFDSLQRVVTQGRTGVFAIGQTDVSGTFRVQRVGRADDDVLEALRLLIGCGNQFKFAIFTSAREAFDTECELFHRLRPPSTIIHPSRPAGTDWKCHWCTQLHL